jgi:hypothetical protein
MPYACLVFDEMPRACVVLLGVAETVIRVCRSTCTLERISEYVCQNIILCMAACSVVLERISEYVCQNIILCDSLTTRAYTEPFFMYVYLQRALDNKLLSPPFWQHLQGLRMERLFGIFIF